ncbi:MAG: serine--tRNA ligase [Deltaproteobacteria bacterium CG11_big_fil_rev_8_21_14_0_20_42_23]|nr:MAG: serine--tRNA ligase [Deltaproteobacteria bacterium CG11_big_fil_rev_8_21_14_0_20_42_23]PJC64972.1 MAG: serine--tRNA ligase [Deltaproteobacteria bacterium CG_4_9_14_0_2_um_filter_42_21]
MLDLKFIRENIEAVKQNCLERNVRHINFDLFLQQDAQRRAIMQSLEGIRQEQNVIAGAMKTKLEAEKRAQFVARGKDLKQQEKDLNEQFQDIEAKLFELARAIPNMTHPDSPRGKTEFESKELRTVGKIPQFSLKPLDHVQLGEKLDLIDFEAGAKVSGQKFYYLKNEAALLEFALIQFALQLLHKKGFTPFITPDLARESILEGIGFNPRGEETQVYSIANTDLCLIGTAEITLGGYLSDKILEEANLPLRYVGVSHCFRTEAGAAGKESKGLYRVHQFTKIEMFAFCSQTESEKIHDEFLALEEEIFQALEIPYRVLDICTGDLGGPAYRKFDLEAWMPGRGEKGEWGEVTSTSNCTDYQSRRLKIRYRPEGSKKTEFVHMLNGTAIAISRALIGLLENHQQADGSILIPKVLQPFMGGITNISR